MMDFSQSTLIGTLKDTRSRQWGDSTSWCLKRKRKKYTLLPHKTKQVLGVADFEGWDLVENVISLVFVRLSTLFFLLFTLHLPERGFRSHITPGTRGCFSRATGSFVLSAEGRRHERRSFSRGSLISENSHRSHVWMPWVPEAFHAQVKSDRNRKPRMKSLWHPGYSHIRTVTIFGVIRMGVYTTPDSFGAGTETTPDMASVNTKERWFRCDFFNVACTRTLFYFSFRSFGKHWRARERKIFHPPSPLSSCAGGQ